MFAKKGEKDKYYDQIAWFAQEERVKVGRRTKTRPALSLNFKRAGHFDFKDVAMSSLGLDKRSLSFRISDHFPLWAEFAAPER